MSLMALKLENLQLNFMNFNKQFDQSTTSVPVKTYLCDICDYETEDTSTLHNHKERFHQVHDDFEEIPEVYSCSKCEYSTQFEESLNKHMKFTHNYHRTRTFYAKKRNEKSEINDKLVDEYRTYFKNT